MKKILATAAEHLAPRTLQNLRRLSGLDPELERALPLLLSYERELRALQREVDDLRRDHRRVAELYDAVFEWAHSNAAARGVAPQADGAATLDRVARELTEDE